MTDRWTYGQKAGIERSGLSVGETSAHWKLNMCLLYPVKQTSGLLHTSEQGDGLLHTHKQGTGVYGRELDQGDRFS